MSPSVEDTLLELFKWSCKVNLTLEDTTKGKKNSHSNPFYSTEIKF